LNGWEIAMAEKNRDPNIVAIEAVYAALKDLDAAVRNRVLSSALALLGVEARSVPGVQQTTSTSQVRESVQQLRPVGLVELMNEKGPGTNAQRIAVFAYYRDKAEGNPRFSRSDLEAYFSRARVPPAANYSRDFGEAVRAGWIHEDGTESYLTTKGVEAVESSFEGERKYTVSKKKKPSVKGRKGAKTRKKK
jgi:hypothetical protein